MYLSLGNYHRIMGLAQEAPAPEPHFKRWLRRRAVPAGVSIAAMIAADQILEPRLGFWGSFIPVMAVGVVTQFAAGLAWENIIGEPVGL